MNSIVSGIITVFDFSMKVLLFYNKVYLLMSLTFVVLLLIRIPSYRKEKRCNKCNK
jgi:hypothetical protein